MREPLAILLVFIAYRKYWRRERLSTKTLLVREREGLLHKKISLVNCRVQGVERGQRGSERTQGKEQLHHSEQMFDI